MNTERIKLFKESLFDLRGLIRQYPDLPPLKSVEKQLEYLIDLEEGNRDDRERLSEITLGIITAREIEDLEVKAISLKNQFLQQYWGRL